MKKLFFILLLIQINTLSFAQTEQETIKKAKELIGNKKYESAFKLLENFDSKNEKPEIAILKTEIAINYFVTSMSHQMFAFKDLQENESIMDYRGKEGSYGMYMFPANQILDSLIKKHPGNFKLNKALGDFYYDVHLRYDNNWLKNNRELFKLMIFNYKTAIDNNVADFMSYYVLGYISVHYENYKESIPYFLKSIDLNKSYPSSHYNLAYAYLYLDDRENALKHAKNSLELYQEKSYKADAARMVAIIYSELKNDKNSIAYFEKSNEIDSNNYYTLKPLLALYIKTENIKSGATLNSFFNLAPANPSIYNDLSDIYFKYMKEKDLVKYYESQVSKFSENKKVLGNLYFYIGKAQLDINKKDAKKSFLKAKEVFSTVYTSDHQVFSAIEEALKGLE